MTAIELQEVSVTYAEADEPVLRGVDLSIDEGELVLVVGRTGSGKSTLLGLLNGLVPYSSGGTVTGTVTVHGRETSAHRPRDLADVVGVVGQDPLAGFVTDTVEDELAYAMEQLGLPPEVMRKRVEETLDLLGIAELRDAPLADLSGGQQQRVAIGAVLTAHPQVLVLDEPTSALDPTGAEEVLAAITRLVHDLGITVVVAEHRIERVLAYADRVVHVTDGRVESGEPATVMRTATVAPPVVELGRWAGWSPLPLSVRDARRMARSLVEVQPPQRSSLVEVQAPQRSSLVEVQAPQRLPRNPGTSAADSPDFEVPAGAIAPRPSLVARKLSVRHGDLVAVREVDLDLRAGQVVALMGRNGAGKSSLLWALQGSGRRSGGSVSVGSGVDAADPSELAPAVRRTRVGLVPQTPTDLLYLASVQVECERADAETRSERGTCRELLDRILPDVEPGTHPRDLSEGQRLALVLAVQLTARPDVLLLDEPTRGLDYQGKAALADVLRGLAAHGHAVLLSTHDVEFTAIVADRVIVMAGGEIVADGPTAEVVTSSPAFAPQISKVLGSGLLSMADVVRTLGEGP